VRARGQFLLGDDLLLGRDADEGSHPRRRSRLTRLG
jgi:hypothetical protein